MLYSCTFLTRIPPVIDEDVEAIERLDVVEPVSRNEDRVARCKLGFLGALQSRRETGKAVEIRS